MGLRSLGTRGPSWPRALGAAFGFGAFGLSLAVPQFPIAEPGRWLSGHSSHMVGGGLTGWGPPRCPLRARGGGSSEYGKRGTSAWSPEKGKLWGCRGMWGSGTALSYTGVKSALCGVGVSGCRRVSNQSAPQTGTARVPLLGAQPCLSPLSPLRCVSPTQHHRPAPKSFLCGWAGCEETHFLPVLVKLSRAQPAAAPCPVLCWHQGCSQVSWVETSSAVPTRY